MSEELSVIDGKALSAPEVARNYFIQNRQQVTDAGDNVDVDRVINAVVRCIEANNALAKCNVNSLLTSTIEAIESGLSLNTSSKEAYLVPFWTKAKGNIAQLIKGYLGLIKVAKDNGVVLDVWSEIVYDGEVNKVVKGDKPSLHHEPDVTKKPDLSKVLYAYAVAKLPNGETHFEVLRRDELDALYEKAKKKGGEYFGSSPWNTDKPMMIRKSAVRRLFNQIGTGGAPSSSKLARVMDVDYDEAIDAYSYNSSGEPKEAPKRGVDAVLNHVSKSNSEPVSEPENSQADEGGVVDDPIEIARQNAMDTCKANGWKRAKIIEILGYEYEHPNFWKEEDFRKIAEYQEPVMGDDPLADVVETTSTPIVMPDDDLYNRFTSLGGTIEVMIGLFGSKVKAEDEIDEVIGKLSATARLKVVKWCEAQEKVQQ